MGVGCPRYAPKNQTSTSFMIYLYKDGGKVKNRGWGGSQTRGREDREKRKRSVDVYLNSHRVGLFTASGGGINSDSFRSATRRQGLLEGAFVAREENGLIKGGVRAHCLDKQISEPGGWETP